jgi:hypothetical protein
MNKIEIHRPINSRYAFEADEFVTRRGIFEHNLSKVNNEQSGMEIAERVFHILNAPEDMLLEEEVEMAHYFRAQGNYSLSTGDIVKVDDEHFLCKSVGWKKIENPIYPLINHA